MKLGDLLACFQRSSNGTVLSFDFVPSSIADIQPRFAARRVVDIGAFAGRGMRLMGPTIMERREKALQSGSDFSDKPVTPCHFVHTKLYSPRTTRLTCSNGLSKPLLKGISHQQQP